MHTWSNITFMLPYFTSQSFNRDNYIFLISHFLRTMFSLENDTSSSDFRIVPGCKFVIYWHPYFLCSEIGKRERYFGFAVNTYKSSSTIIISWIGTKVARSTTTWIASSACRLLSTRIASALICKGWILRILGIAQWI